MPRAQPHLEQRSSGAPRLLRAVDGGQHRGRAEAEARTAVRALDRAPPAPRVVSKFYLTVNQAVVDDRNGRHLGLGILIQLGGCEISAGLVDDFPQGDLSVHSVRSDSKNTTLRSSGLPGASGRWPLPYILNTIKIPHVHTTKTLPEALSKDPRAPNTIKKINHSRGADSTAGGRSCLCGSGVV